MFAEPPEMFFISGGSFFPGPPTGTPISRMGPKREEEMKSLYRSVSNEGNAGFTLIELLVVVTIIGILTTIALPGFLGQREKAKVRSVEASARGAVPELQGLLDSLAVGDPFVVLAEDGSTICVESAYASGLTCQAIYGMPMTGEYTDIYSVIDYYIQQQRARDQVSPFNGGQDLFVTSDNGIQGAVVLAAANGHTVSLRAYADNPAMPVYETALRSR